MFCSVSFRGNFGNSQAQTGLRLILHGLSFPMAAGICISLGPMESLSLTDLYLLYPAL